MCVSLRFVELIYRKLILFFFEILFFLLNVGNLKEYLFLGEMYWLWKMSFYKLIVILDKIGISELSCGNGLEWVFFVVSFEVSLNLVVVRNIGKFWLVGECGSYY